MAASRSRTTGESSTINTGFRRSGGRVGPGASREVSRGGRFSLEGSSMGFDASQVQVGLQLLAAIRANAVAETDVGMSGDVAFHAVPVIAVVPDFFAVTTDREQSLQGFHGRHRFLEFLDAVGQGGLEPDDARTDLHAGAELG